MSIGHNNNLRIVIAAHREQARSNRRRKMLILGVGSLPVLAAALLLGAYALQIDLAGVVAAATHAQAGAMIIHAEPAAMAGTPPAPDPAPTAPAALRANAAAPNLSVNGVAQDSFIVFTAAARQRARQVFSRGRALGRNPHAIAKVGDSTMVYPPFLAAFGTTGEYRLGRYAYLQPTIDYYADSLGRTSAAAKKGMHTWSEFDPAWSASEQCQADEPPMQCELRLTNPSIAIIRLGANDTYDQPAFTQNLRKIVEFWLDSGVVPVLGTKPDRFEGPANTLNKIIRQTAAAYNIPLWDYDVIAGTVPNRGLEADNIHIRGEGSHDFAASAAFQSGDSLEDLTALMMLDRIRREVSR